jgi:hypothetical protein
MSAKGNLRSRATERELSLGLIRLRDVDYNSLLFRAPEQPGSPCFMLELNLKRLDFFITSAAGVFSFPDIISGI